VRKVSPPTGIQSLDCQASSESLYHLHYPSLKKGKKYMCVYVYIYISPIMEVYVPIIIYMHVEFFVYR